jgi:hypothetical protein
LKKEAIGSIHVEAGAWAFKSEAGLYCLHRSENVNRLQTVTSQKTHQSQMSADVLRKD